MVYSSQWLRIMQWKYREIALKGSIFQELLGNEHDSRPCPARAAAVYGRNPAMPEGTNVLLPYIFAFLRPFLHRVRSAGAARTAQETEFGRAICAGCGNRRGLRSTLPCLPRPPNKVYRSGTLWHNGACDDDNHWVRATFVGATAAGVGQLFLKESGPRIWATCQQI